MKFKYALFITALAFATFLITSCSDNETGPSNPKEQSIYLQGTDVYDEDIFAELLICQTKDYNAQLQRFVEYPSFDCSFTDPTRLYAVQAGAVTLNSESVPRYGAFTQGAPTDSVYTYGDSEWGSKAAFNGSQNVWTVSGGSNIPAFNISVNSPGYKIEFTSPRLNQNVSKASGFTITWNNGGAPAQSVWINIRQEGSGNYETLSSDTGSLVIAPAALAKFQAGELWIDAYSYNYTLQDIGGGKYAVAVVSSAYSLPVTLN